MHKQKIFWFILLFGLLIRGYILCLPFTEIFNRWGSDDLFYYTQIAGNFHEKGIFSFDGTIPTNGFQVLFEFLLIPFGAFLKDNLAGSFYFVQFVQISLSILALFQLKKLNEQLGFHSSLNLVLCGLFFIHPKLISVAFNGTEFALSFLFFILSLRAYCWMKKGEKWIYCSLIFSGFVLTRLDFSLYLLFLGFFALINRQSILAWIKVLVLPVFLFLTWLFFNQYYFGAILPSSGEAKQLIIETISVNRLAIFLSSFGTALYSETKISILVSAFFIVGIYTLVKRNNKELNMYFLALFTFSVASSLLIVNTIVYFRDWYLIAHFSLVLLTSAFGLEFAFRFLNKKVWIGTFSVLFVLLIWTEANYSDRKFNGTLTIKACEEFKYFIQEEKQIAAFNAGIIGTQFGTENIRTINLDGVVNNAVIPFLKKKTLEIYLRQENVHYLIDNRASIDYFLNNFSDSLKYEIIKTTAEEKNAIILAKLKY